MTVYYQDATVTLYHGDCLEISKWITADVLVTDPPYGVALELEWAFTRCSVCLRPSRSRSGTCRECRGGQPGVSRVVKVAGDDSARVRDQVLDLWGSKPALVFGSWNIPRPVATRHRLIWSKGDDPGQGDLSFPWGKSDEEIYVIGSGFTGARGPNVIRCNKPPNNTRGGHPTPKPTALMESLISKCPPGVVADPFAGSGSTLVAAKALGRHAVGVELEERYCEVIAKRLAQDAFDFGPTDSASRSKQ